MFALNRQTDLSPLKLSSLFLLLNNQPREMFTSEIPNDRTLIGSTIPNMRDTTG